MTPKTGLNLLTRIVEEMKEENSVSEEGDKEPTWRGKVKGKQLTKEQAAKLFET